VEVPFPLVKITVVIDSTASLIDAGALKVDVPACGPVWQLFAHTGTRFDVDQRPSGAP
jgi:hypothetical protein